MKTSAILITVLMSLVIGGNAEAQISCISPPPYDVTGLNYKRMHGSEFKEASFDFPFIDERERKLGYAQLWVNTDVLNVRTGPTIRDSIITENFLGERVVAYAKKGDWVAIRRPISYKNFKMSSRWVNIRYLSTHPIKEQVGLEVLKRKCSFKRFGEYDPKKALDDFENKILNSCSSVRGYLRQQGCLSKPHPYLKDYKNWRSAQTEPDIYQSFP